MFDTNEFKNKVVLVTGGSRGIGRAVVESFASLGAKVAFTYIKNSTEAAALADKYTDVFPIQADSSVEEDVVNAVKTVIARFKDIDILVLNAGITKDRVSWKLESSNFEDVIDVNLKGPFYFAKTVVPYLREKETGKIITVSSINGIRGKAGQTAYSASKGGLIAFTRALAKELGPKNINVNSVAPGLILTDMTKALPKEIIDKAIDESSLKRVGKPEDVANAVLFLASHFASHITGQVLNIDGGQLI
ncbi:MAG: 3-oxoacyl-ACP reductase FabG [Deltaproteobacteria bacterium]|nr:3-oxoacyl-ACP reductase FabG [Deltaproteobacteria bacterium]